MNQYDSNKIVYYLNKFEKYILVDSYDIANIIILNTCSVRHNAQEKLFHLLGRIQEYKYKKSNVIVCVGGCVSVQEKKNIFLRSKAVDIIFTPKNISQIHHFITQFRLNHKKIINFDFVPENDYKYGNTLLQKKFFSYVTITEGCNKYCTYCIVPFTRGKEVSRNPEIIIKEIKYLVSTGIQDINLLGQNVNSYISFYKDGRKCSFVDLLYKISEIPGVTRLRFTTSHPICFTDELIMAYKDIQQLVNYLHLPVQSGSNIILKKMCRNYTVELYQEIIRKILLVRPNMLFGTDFIVGFPGETKDDFALTLKLALDIKFDTSYLFIYSPRPGTVACNMQDNVSLVEKKYRLFKLQKLIKRNIYYWNNKLLGSLQKVLVEGFINKKNNFMYGRADNNKIIYLTGYKELLGSIITVKLVNVYYNCLYGIIQSL